MKRVPVDTMLDVGMFHAKFGIDQPPTAYQMSRDLFDFRLNFLKEEIRELELAYERGDLAAQLDALADLVYVGVGTALIAGMDFDEAWARIHSVNMQKRRALPDGSDSLRFSKYDVVKPEGWRPADLSDLVSPDHQAPVQLLLLERPPHFDPVVTPETF